MSAAPNWEITFLFIMTPCSWKEILRKRNFFSLPERFWIQALLRLVKADLMTLHIVNENRKESCQG
jgi:hypothetical protein